MTLVIRKNSLAALAAQACDLIIIGGGINGGGLLREAALRGLKAVLFEKDDFGSRTSGRSSKLIHGGMRYLETRDWKLVSEACHERQTLLKVAPTLVKPLPFLYPIYKDAKRGIFQVTAGVWLYDVLAGMRNIRHPTIRLKKSTLDLEPRLRTKGLSGSAMYFDAVTHDAELTVANIRSGRASGGLAFNHVRVTDLIEKEGAITGVGIKDEISGDSISISARWIVNLTGPYSDQFLSSCLPGSPKKLRVTKGVHMILAKNRLKSDRAFLLHSPRDGRVAFLIPWEGFSMVGTTDTDYDGDLDHVTADEFDVGYLLDVLNFYFPSEKLTTDDVISTFAGVRPLLADTHANPSGVSREHRIFQERPGLVSMNGGKLTTYRKMAEELLNWIADRSPDLKNKIHPSCSAERRIDADFSEEHLRGERLLGTQITWEQIVRSVKVDGAMTITDVLAYRTFLTFLDRNHAKTLIGRVGTLLSQTYGYSKETIEAQDLVYQRVMSEARAGLHRQS